MCSEKRYISFVALPLMKYAFLASLDEINGIYSFQKVEHLLFMSKFVVYNFCEEQFYVYLLPLNGMFLNSNLYDGPKRNR